MPEQHLLLGQVGFGIGNAHFLRIVLRDEGAHLVTKRSVLAGKIELHRERLPLPLLAERANFQLERPGALGLLIKQPVGFRDRGWRHQQIGIIERVRAQRLDPPLPHPFGVDAGVDDEMRDVDVLGAQLARGRLRNGPQAELGAGEGRISRSAAQGSRSRR